MVDGSMWTSGLRERKLFSAGRRTSGGTRLREIEREMYVLKLKNLSWSCPKLDPMQRPLIDNIN